MTAGTGIDHTYRNGDEAAHFAILESLGGGVALIDYDGDGLLDIFLPGGGYFDKNAAEYKQDPSKPPQVLGHPCKLYKNLGGWKFKDVTKEVGLDGLRFYTHGAAVADYDRDGWPDLLVTGWGRLALFHNESDGHGGRRFVDVTAKAGLNDDSWSTSAAWADFDGDGYPDLYVCHYVDWGFDKNRKHPLDCTYDGKTHDVCAPKAFTGLPHLVYRNNGDGTFTDVSKEAGLRMPRDEKDYDQLTFLDDDAKKRLRQADKDKDYGKGLGVIAVDFNGDRKPDVYVANDTVDNHLYMNRSVPGKIRFDEVGFMTGVARDDRGSADGSMGLAAADYDGCGRPSLWVTNYENELHCLYHNDCKDGRESFLFATYLSGIAAVGKWYVGWGTGFLDIDHHGWEDLFVVNGHAIRFPTGQAPRAQRALLLRNMGFPVPPGKKQFMDLTAQGGSYFQGQHVARGVAFGDLDNDGRIDAVISHLNEPVVVLRNVADVGTNHWLGIELVGKGHRDVVGAKATLEVGERRQTRFAQGGGSYASSSDRRQVFGLGPVEKVGRLTVVWPSGLEQHWDGLAVDQYWRLSEGEAEAQKAGGMKQ